MNFRGICVMVLFICVNLVRRVRNTNENRAEFELLCKFYKLTQTPLTWSLGSLSVESVITELELLNMSTSPEDWYNLFSGSAGPEGQWAVVREKAPFKGKLSENDDWQQNYDRWNELKRKIISTESGDPQFARPPNSAILQEYHAKIRRSLEKVLGLDGTLKTRWSQINASVQEINKNLGKVLAGATSEKGQVTGDSFVDDGNRGASCAKAVEAGISLANDITCLCVPQSSTSDVCGKMTAGAWDDGGSRKGSAAYVEIAQECDKKKTGIVSVNASIIHHLLSDFAVLLGRYATTNADDNYILGQGRSNDCAATSGATGLCVAYKKALQGAAAAGIPWIEQLKKVAHQLDEFERAKQQAQRLVDQAHHFLASAQLEYAAALASRPPTHSQYNDGKNASGNQAAVLNAKAEEIETPVKQLAGKGGDLQTVLIMLSLA